ncbi:MAG: sulfur carrier protein ThiS [Endomicrobiia bacterium]
MITFNGKKVEKYSTLENLIKENGYSLNNVVVLLNEKIVKKSEWKKIKLKKGDVIEVVGFVGGG